MLFYGFVIVAVFQRANSGKVVNISSKEGKKEPPPALNTVELLRVASSAFNLSPATTMSVAENLYTKVRVLCTLFQQNNCSFYCFRGLSVIRELKLLFTHQRLIYWNSYDCNKIILCGETSQSRS